MICWSLWVSWLVFLFPVTMFPKDKSLWRPAFTQRGTMCLRNFLNAGFQHSGVYYDT